ncbi:hypothetical protein DNO_0262 [Dichelobacter nodosus VCS1703A]|uniref:Uncharacterized protein n=1 Tax=Dichelobacter nodosus (strain VCS1703A) TaxID=246195 RepID=A5EWB7_DICNV|nr:hypothetical protein DNO_0262 [Dichelobacter nodosus VCS1703A]
MIVVTKKDKALEKTAVERIEHQHLKALCMSILLIMR